MSFFCDFLDCFNMESIEDEVRISMVLGVGIGIVGTIKILSLSDSLIVIKSVKRKIILSGSVLKIVSMSKGEFIVSGKIENLKIEEL